MPGARRNRFEFEGDLVRVAPEPALTWLERTDEWMSGQREVLRGVTSRRAVAATYVAALLAHP